MYLWLITESALDSKMAQLYLRASAILLEYFPLYTTAPDWVNRFPLSTSTSRCWYHVTIPLKRETHRVNKKEAAKKWKYLHNKSMSQRTKEYRCIWQDARKGNFRIDSFLYIIFIWVSGELGEIDAGEKVLEVGGYWERLERGRILSSFISAWHRWSAIVTGWLRVFGARSIFGQWAIVNSRNPRNRMRNKGAVTEEQKGVTAEEWNYSNWY